MFANAKIVYAFYFHLVVVFVLQYNTVAMNSHEQLVIYLFLACTLKLFLFLCYNATDICFVGHGKHTH
jgi:hypothetical protein